MLHITKIVFVLLVGLSGFYPTSEPQAEDFDDSISRRLNQPEWFRHDPFYDLGEVLQSARAGGKQGLMLVYGTEGCAYCEAFIHKSLGNPELASLVRRKFVSLYLEIFDDNEMVTPGRKTMSIKEFAKQEGVQFSPTLLFYDTDGKRILRVTGYQSPQRFRKILGYVSNRHYKSESLRTHYKHLEAESNSNPASYDLRQDPIFKSSPYDLMRNYFPQKKPELILFEKPGCRACADFHDEVLSLKQVRSGLDQFVVIRLDPTDNKTPVRGPNGRLTTPAAWFKNTDLTQLPALIFFNKQGEKVLETDALVKRQRLMNSINYVIERAYEKGWTYQRFARTRGIARNHQRVVNN